VLVLQSPDNVIAAREPHDALRRIGRRTPALLELGYRPDDRSDGNSIFCLDDHGCAGARPGLGREIGNRQRVRATDGCELDRDEANGIRRDHGCTFLYRRGSGLETRP
jgi:hypothetical protein